MIVELHKLVRMIQLVNLKAFHSKEQFVYKSDFTTRFHEKIAILHYAELMARSYEFIQFDSYQNVCFLEKVSMNVSRLCKNVQMRLYDFATNLPKLVVNCHENVLDITTFFMKSRFSVNNYLHF